MGEVGWLCLDKVKGMERTREQELGSLRGQCLSSFLIPKVQQGCDRGERISATAGGATVVQAEPWKWAQMQKERSFKAH